MNVPILDNPKPFCVKGKAEAIVLIRTAHGDQKNVLEEIRRIDALTEAYYVHGSYDILARFKTKKYECLSKLLNIKIKKIKGVKRARNLLIA